MNTIYKPPKYRKAGQGILDEKGDSTYPKFKVILLYTVLQGGIGGVFFAMYNLLFSDSAVITNAATPIIIFLVLGAIFGSIPAAITGVIITQLTITIRDALSYIVIATIGFSVALLFTGITGGATGIDLLVIALCGGLSAMIVAVLVVPKH